MHFVLLSNYNNYYNRIYKKLNTYQQYIAAADGNVQVLDKSVNFDLQDGVMTQHIFNCTFDGEPNYCLLLNETDNSIASRWFVIEWDKVRGNQYRAILRRDLLADHYDAITTAPAFIEKGYVSPEDSAIFNKEDITVNQIKTRETLLKDDSKTAWIVGYVARDHSALTGKSFTLNPQVDVTISGNHTDWEYASLVDGTEHTTLNTTSPNGFMRFVIRWVTFSDDFRYEFDFNGSSHSTKRVGPPQVQDFWSVNNGRSYLDSDWYSGINWNTCMDKVFLDNPSWTTVSDYNYLLNLATTNATIQFNDGVYRVSLVGETESLQDNWSYWADGELYNYLYSIVDTGADITSTYRYPVAYRLQLKKFRFTLTQVTNIQGSYTYSIPQTVKGLDDAPYKMFAIPYCKQDAPYLFTFDNSSFYYCDKDLMMAWAMSIARELGGGGQSSSIYDLQILPYCPLSNWRGRKSTPGIWSLDKTLDTDYILLKDNQNATVGVCSWCNVSSKEQYLEYPITITNYKLENQLDMYRLCSPNYAAAFEFNAARNDGVEGYNVRYTYKPYQPFINVAPKFGRLYGRDFNDNRGLILAGDFSLPIVSDAWTNYQLSNKNYQLTFDRQIENMEVQYGWQRAQGIANAVVGTIQGGTTGALAGGMMGGGPGAIAGAIIGTGSALAGGIIDVNMQKALHNEAIDFAKDNFGYQLGNIKALPNTLNKVSSIVANSKLFPFVEYYTCTNEEKQAFDDKLKYNGMSIGRIGHILDFKHPDAQTYIKGQIIRLEGKFDTHTANEIANEFNKGWYI